MFKLELIELLSKYNKCPSSEKENIENSIKTLIENNKTEFDDFINLGSLGETTNQFLQNLSSKIVPQIEPNDNLPTSTSDIDLIKQKFSQWLDFYNKNNKVADENCIDIVEKLINFYILNRFEVLEQILKINDTLDFEAFKNMLKNFIRQYYSIKLIDYLESIEYKNLGFFQKRKKNLKIEKISNKLNQYDFKNLNLEEVIK